MFSVDAGGDKYIVHSILFKFAVDSHGLYGDDAKAAKVAGHELRGMFGLTTSAYVYRIDALLQLSCRCVCTSVLYHRL
jgi:hypothetical protein